jgi:hypothetical protein
MGKHKLTLNTIKTGGNDDEEERSQRQKELRKNGRQDLVGPYVHARQHHYRPPVAVSGNEKR